MSRRQTRRRKTWPRSLRVRGLSMLPRLPARLRTSGPQARIANEKPGHAETEIGGVKVTVKAGLALTNDEELEGLVRGSGAKALPVDLAKIDDPSIDKLDVLIVDLREQPGLPDELAGFRRKHPQIGVIIVTSVLDPTLMLEALRAGVNECVTAPLKQEDLTAAIDRLMGQRADTSAPGDIFVFMGAKGGVGTTTVAVNFAAALAQDAPGNTLFIDLHHAYGDAAVFLGVESRFSVLDALENTHRLDKNFSRDSSPTRRHVSTSSLRPTARAQRVSTANVSTPSWRRRPSSTAMWSWMYLGRIRRHSKRSGSRAPSWSWPTRNWPPSGTRAAWRRDSDNDTERIASPSRSAGRTETPRLVTRMSKRPWGAMYGTASPATTRWRSRR